MIALVSSPQLEFTTQAGKWIRTPPTSVTV